MVFTEIIALRWVILAHIGVALFLLAFCSLLSEKRFFSRWKVLFMGSILSMNAVCRTAWCISLSRLITVIVYACMPGQADFLTGAIIGLETLLIILVEGDLKADSAEILTFTAVYMTLFLQGLFYKYFLEVESMAELPLVAIFLGGFAGLTALRQTLAVHEQLIRKSNRELTESLLPRRKRNRGKEGTNGDQ